LNGLNDNWIEKVWYGSSLIYWVLLPFTLLFAVVVASRRYLYSRKILRSNSVDVPVIVVGNITAGGTGKTPVTIWLARALAKSGRSPGIISRGYRGKVGPRPLQAKADSKPAVVGDEAILLASQCDCPVVVHPDRTAAAKMAIELGANIVISDDGLQHYRLRRDFEIAVVDGNRGFGNGNLLPAGPLREPIARMKSVDRILIHRHSDDEREIFRRSYDTPPLSFRLQVTGVSRLDNSQQRKIEEFAGTTVHAVAGIGHPERFFLMLEAHGIDVKRHPLPDHADITPDDIVFDDDLEILMTEKDAVKCQWMDTSNCWYVPVEVDFEGADADMLLDQVLAVRKDRERRKK
jgi:tetraacyldisaccharide 4'-kinase